MTALGGAEAQSGRRAQRGSLPHPHLTEGCCGRRAAGKPWAAPENTAGCNRPGPRLQVVRGLELKEQEGVAGTCLGPQKTLPEGRHL